MNHIIDSILIFGVATLIGHMLTALVLGTILSSVLDRIIQKNKVAILLTLAASLMFSLMLAAVVSNYNHQSTMRIIDEVSTNGKDSALHVLYKNRNESLMAYWGFLFRNMPRHNTHSSKENSSAYKETQRLQKVDKLRSASISSCKSNSRKYLPKS